MILVDLKKGIIQMQGNGMTLNAEVGISLRPLHEAEKQHYSQEMGDKTIDSLCKSAKLSEEEIKARLEEREEGHPFVSKIADLFDAEILNG